MPSRTVVFVDDPAISALFEEGQMVGRWGTRVQREIVNESKVEAPKRTTELANSIRGAGALKRLFGLERRVVAAADHALYVHEGTAGPIFPKNSRMLLVPAAHGGLPARQGGQELVLREAVRGQSANPFLVRGARTVMLRHGVA